MFYNWVSVYNCNYVTIHVAQDCEFSIFFVFHCHNLLFENRKYLFPTVVTNIFLIPPKFMQRLIQVRAKKIDRFNRKSFPICKNMEKMHTQLHNSRHPNIFKNISSFQFNRKAGQTYLEWTGIPK